MTALISAVAAHVSVDSDRKTDQTCCYFLQVFFWLPSVTASAKAIHTHMIDQSIAFHTSNTINN